MFDPSLQTQIAIGDAIQAAKIANSFTVDPLLTDSMDVTGFENSLPFVLIGDDTVIDDGESGCGKEYEIRAFIRCHAEGPSREDVKILANEVRHVLWNADLETAHDFIMFSDHAGSRAELIEGIAHVVVVEWELRVRDPA